MTIETASKELTGTYAIDPAHSTVGFVARHAMVAKVRGSFNKFEGTGYLDVEHPEASHLELLIDAASIDTRNADRDAHLKSNDFFEMETYPEISFKSTAVAAGKESVYRVTGDLTIKGITKPITIDFEYLGAAKDPFGNERVGFEGATVVSRKDWGLTWNAPLETGGLLVSENVTLEFEISAIKQAA